MKKMFYALMALMVLTSCGDKKNNNGTNPLTGEKTENGTEAESKVEFNDQPLLAISEYESPDWYVPVGYTPSSSNENLDYENFTEEQCATRRKRPLTTNCSRRTWNATPYSATSRATRRSASSLPTSTKDRRAPSPWDGKAPNATST